MKAKKPLSGGNCEAEIQIRNLLEWSRGMDHVSQAIPHHPGWQPPPPPQLRYASPFLSFPHTYPLAPQNPPNISTPQRISPNSYASQSTAVHLDPLLVYASTLINYASPFLATPPLLALNQQP
jgi:hypothetical protein